MPSPSPHCRTQTSTLWPAPAPPGDASCARSPRPRPSSPSTITRWSPNITVHFYTRGPRRPPAEGSADSSRPRPLRGLCECLSAASDRLAPLPPMRTLTHLGAAQRPRRALIEGLRSSARGPAIPKRGPLFRTRARYSEAGSSRPHAGPLFRSWALSSAREPAISYEGGLAHAPISRFGLLNTRRCRVASLDVRPAHGLVLHSLFALWPRGISFGPGRRWALELHSRAL